jgi:hypothetical protein
MPNTNDNDNGNDNVGFTKRRRLRVQSIRPWSSYLWIENRGQLPCRDLRDLMKIMGQSIDWPETKTKLMTLVWLMTEPPMTRN